MEGRREGVEKWIELAGGDNEVKERGDVGESGDDEREGKEMTCECSSSVFAFEKETPSGLEISFPDAVGGVPSAGSS